MPVVINLKEYPQQKLAELQAEPDGPDKQRLIEALNDALAKMAEVCTDNDDVFEGMHAEFNVS